MNVIQKTIIRLATVSYTIVLLMKYTLLISTQSTHEMLKNSIQSDNLNSLFLKNTDKIPLVPIVLG